MQQLNSETIRQALSSQSDIIQVQMALPATPLKTEQFIHELAQAGGFRASNIDWGADRCQAILTKQDISAVLCIEWLCEAIWIEPTGTTDLVQIWHAFGLR
ncbi:hypothetical protein IT774_00465 [Salinimonas marina]|uniref:DUF3630 family protein n=1 Tax=Salinimonas marina TaxID=2785918 RepID=A0A7S9DXN6_9ALTE|nr:hypothetical protein [Salinimonas marina]QPG05798.1 hypothetical protein IT774_00465 [Salinimonas marina]